MANTRISDLTASASNLASTDLTPVVQTVGVGPVKMTGLQLAGGLLGSTTFNGSTVTTSQPVLNLTQTWNDGNVTFTGLKFNAAGSSDANSASGSLLLDLQVGGASKLSADKSGLVTATSSAVGYGGGLKSAITNNSGVASIVVAGISNGVSNGDAGLFVGGRNQNVRNVYGLTGNFADFSAYTDNGFAIGNYNAAPLIFGTNNIERARFLSNSAVLQISSSGSLAWSSGTTTAPDLLLTRATTATLQLGAADAAAPVAQTFKVQSGTAGASATTVSISGTSLTIAGTVTGTIAIGHAVTGTGVSAGTLITAGSGTSWTVNNSQTVGPITAYFNSVGADFTIRGSQGSGPSAGGSLIFQVAPAGSAATTAQNAYSTALTIGADRNLTMWGNGAAFYFESASGFEYFGSGTIVARSAGARVAAFKVTGSGQVCFSSGASVGFTSGSAESTALDTILARDGQPNTLALRNGPNAQTFNVYETYTDATTYRRAYINSASGTATFGWEGLGSGNTTGNTIISSGSGSGSQIYFRSANTLRWTIDGSGHFLASADNAYDIGASGTSRPRDVYVGGKVLAQKANSEVTAPYIGISRNINGGASLAYLAADGSTSGNLVLYNASVDNFGRLQFGGTTSSFPALKRSSASLICRLADDTANAAFESASVKTDAPSGGTSGTWKLGVRVAATTTLDTTQYIEVDVGGTLYKLAVVTS